MGDERLYEPADTPRLTYLSYNEVAAGLNVSVRTLIRWIKAGQVPGPQYLGGAARFPLDYVKSVLEAGVKLPNTFKPMPSRRSETMKRVVKEKTAAKRGKRKRKNRPRTRPAKKPAAKPKKGGAK